jgi:hypothetical protein
MGNTMQVELVSHGCKALRFFVRLVLVSVLGVLASDAGQIAITRELESDIRDKAFHTERDSPARVPTSIRLLYLPSAHPESMIVIRFEDQSRASIEYMQAARSSAQVIQRLRSTTTIEPTTAAKLMAVKKMQLDLDQGIALAWLKDFDAAVAKSLTSIVQNPFKRTAQLDGTLYKIELHGQVEVSIDVTGSELGGDGSEDVPLVRWMNHIRRQAEELIVHKAQRGN